LRAKEGATEGEMMKGRGTLWIHLLGGISSRKKKKKGRAKLPMKVQELGRGRLSPSASKKRGLK